MHSEIYRFIHFSDIHFGQEKNGTLVVHEDIRAQAIRDCRVIAEQLGSAHGILVTGDIAYSGKRKEYQRAGDWLDEIISVVGCGERAVFVVPGNHDIDKDKIGFIGDITHDKLRKASIEQVDGILEKISKDEEAINPLLPKFGAYREFAARFECDFESPHKPIWSKDCIFSNTNLLRFVGLNSAQTSAPVPPDSIGELVLGNTQYVLSDEDNCEYVVMMHHPLTWFKDRRNIERYLRRARVIIVGHEHNYNIRKLVEDDGSERLEIFAGATTPDAIDGSYEYRYNWIEFRLVNDGKINALDVTVYPRIWDRNNPRFIPDRNRLNGKESATFTLACPKYKETGSRCLRENSSAIDQHITLAVSDNDLEVMVPNMSTGENENFARLKYFFWKYLDWQKRLEVLVHINALPGTASQPLPQTMERLALESAKGEGKLAELWAAVMENVPKDKQEANPFV